MVQSRQKSYTDVRRRELEFEVDDWVYLKVSPMKGVMRFGKKGKLSSRYIGPYRISKRVDLVLLFNSRLCLFLGILTSKWTGPFLLTKVLPHGVVELENSEGTRFMVNGQRIKIYLRNAESVQEVVETYYLDEL
ncbi:hypothetical protein MTR67_031013 [Solanum verrucosum]|uniref:Tf2-1-like SH3-like domain-containing protein n=1 Tax=Solanum verrucosum TaxID=315347 RepID=A0AAF0U1P0_SOLVR|nr:hypothetical protein MTR67_031013 [Solanum verrucosum]